MVEIGSGELDGVLLALNDQLMVADAVARLVVIGISGLIAIDAVSRTTRDVDVVALEEDGVLISAEPLPAPLREAATTVARDLGLEPNWLNAGPAGLLIHGLPAGFVERLIPATTEPRSGSGLPHASTKSSLSSMRPRIEGSQETSLTCAHLNQPRWSCDPQRTGRGRTTCPGRLTMRSLVPFES